MNVITQASTIIAAIGLLCYLTFHRIASVAGYLLTPSKINKHALPRVTVSQHDYLSQLTGYKELYFKLQRLEDYPDVLPQARGMLLKLLAESLILARSRSTDRSILDIKCYSEEVMNNFLASENEW